MEEAVADIDVENGLIVCELGVRGGGRLRNLPPFLSRNWPRGKAANSRILARGWRARISAMTAA